MAIEGLWLLQILPPPVTSGGVVVFVNNKVFGGDNGFCWEGSYTTDGNVLRGRVRVHNFDRDIKSILGISGDYELHIQGNIEGNVLTGMAVIANQPQHRLAIRLEKRVAL